jgi:putative OPT family oligopeptide transporter
VIKPFIPPEEHVREFTFKALFLGIILVVLMTAANAYIGLYAGLTVSASIPAAVISMTILRGVLRRGTVLENNIVQTITSSGGSIATGSIFTIPALVITGAWSGFEFWPTLLITLSGGLLGVIFAIPLRRALIVEEEELVFPEGVACAEVIKTGDRAGGGFLAIVKGFLLGGVIKYFVSAFQAARGAGAGGTLEAAALWRGRAFFFGCDVSPALIGVGYIVGLEVAALVIAGGAVSWLIAVPLTGLQVQPGGSVVDAVWGLWSARIRYLGVGAMLVGGLWSLVSMRRGLVRGLKALRRHGSAGTGEVPRTEMNISIQSMLAVTILCCGLMFVLFRSVAGGIVFSAGLMVGITLLCFFAVAVSSYIVGIVGSSNNPVSGITICGLMIVAGIFYLIGMKGPGAIAGALCVAGVVCCAACAAGDMSQDLKTGYLLGATPRLQQVGQMLGVVVAALSMVPVFTLLHLAYGIGTGLRAPQATLFAGITRSFFGDSSLPTGMVAGGVAIGLSLLVINFILYRLGVKYRFHVMPFAVGMYLPLTLTVPMLLGGIVHHFASRKRAQTDGVDSGVLLSSGMIAGEAVMGIVIAVMIMARADFSLAADRTLDAVLSIAAVLGVFLYLFRCARKPGAGAA